MKSRIAFGLVAVALASAFTVVVPGKPDGGNTMIVGIPIRPDARRVSRSELLQLSCP